MAIERSGAAGSSGPEEDAVPTTCPACGYHVAALFYDGGEQPLATLGWPRSAKDARRMRRLPLKFVTCVDCGHVFNAAFDYAHVPYADQPNRMFNRGARWSEFLESLRGQMLGRVGEAPVVVEIGHGDGHLLEALARARPTGRYIGFDPNGAASTDNPRVELRREVFLPLKHMAEFSPDLLISRHVLEHLSDPLAFVQGLSYASAASRFRPLLYLEVPCVDRALETGRIEDFYYEHNSHFTTESFSRMLARSFTSIAALDHGYNGEVVYAFLRLKGRLEHLERMRTARLFREFTGASKQVITLELGALVMEGKRVAIWGGTGKSAAFIHAYGLDAARFPLVVDSDPDKAGAFVPGTGQAICYRDALLAQPPDVVLIPCQWRARDIVEEMARAGIRCQTVLLPHQGRLVNYFSDRHPYGCGAPALAEPTTTM